MILGASVVPFALVAAGALVIAGGWALDRRTRGRPRSERRRHVRAESAAPVIVRRDQRMDATHAVDVSLGGILIAGPEDLEVGDTVVIVYEGQERPAKVVRTTPQGHRALIFD